MNRTYRLFISLFFFISGVQYASLTARIPTLKSNFGFNDIELGALLLIMPVSSLVGLQLAGWLIARFSSKFAVSAAFGFNTVVLAYIGFAQNVYALIAGICLFSFSMRIFSISINVQAIALQNLYDKKIIGSFHALWSLGGIGGILITTAMVSAQISLTAHLLAVSALNLLLTIWAYRFLLNDGTQGTRSKFNLSNQDSFIVYLGIIAFLAAMCEGAMLDWSGVYFKEILDIRIFTYGYLVFMSFVTLSRFMSDFMMNTIGLRRYYIINSVLIFAGMALPAFFPTVVWAIVGFSLVGIGTAPIIPMTYILAATNEKYSSSVAISLIATYALLGMFAGPPIVGFLAHLFDLKVSFFVLSLIGFSVAPVSVLFFRLKATKTQANGG
ncbi:MAG TPA: MFS transporter [Sphingobacteriaceae bacterium]